MVLTYVHGFFVDVFGALFEFFDYRDLGDSNIV